MVVYLSLVLLESRVFVESPRNFIGLGGCKEDVPDSERFQPVQCVQGQFLPDALPAEFFQDLNFSDVGESCNSWSEERLFPNVPVEEAGVYPVGLGDEQMIIPYLRKLAGVAERVSYAVQGAVLAFNIRQVRFGCRANYYSSGFYRIFQFDSTHQLWLPIPERCLIK